MAKKTITTNNIDGQILALADKIKEIKSVNQYPYLVERIVNIKSEIQNKEFRLTVVGEFSSGKSTFLNALIGRDILPHAVSETTATITYIHNVPKRDKMENKAVVHFNEVRADETLDILSEKQKFQDYLSALNKNGDNIVKLVRAVDVYVNFSEITDPIVIVDTPGLNGVADGHRDVTMREISRSHASICLFHLRGVGQTDLQFMRELQKYQDTFFFVINQIDDLKKQEETPEHRIESFRKEVSESIYEGKLVPKRVYGISGLMALVGQDTSIDYLYQQDIDDGKDPITPEERKRFFEESRFDILKTDLWEYLGNNDKGKQFYGSIFQQLESILADVLSSNEKLKEIYEADLSDIPEKHLLEEELRKLKDLAAQNKYKLKSNIGSEIDDYTNQLKAEEFRACNSQIDVLSREFQNISDVEEIKRFNENNRLGQMTSNFYATRKNSLERNIGAKCNEIFKNQIDEANKSMSRFSFKKFKENVNVGLNVTLSSETYQQSRDRVQKTRNELNSINQQISSNDSSRRSIQSDLASKQSSLQEKRREKENALRNEVPEFKETIERRERKELVKKSGFWGGVCRLFGSDRGWEEKVVGVDIIKHNNQSEITQKRQEIESRFYPQINQLQSSVNDLQLAISQNEYTAKMLKERLDRKQQELSRAIADRDQEIAIAKKSWVEKQKKAMREQVAQWFENGGEVYNALLEGIRDNMAECKKKMQTEIEEYYDQKLDECEKQIYAMIKRLTTQGELGEKNKQLSVIDGDIKIMDACKSEIVNLKKQL